MYGFLKQNMPRDDLGRKLAAFSRIDFQFFMSKKVFQFILKAIWLGKYLLLLFSYFSFCGYFLIYRTCITSMLLLLINVFFFSLTTDREDCSGDDAAMPIRAFSIQSHQLHVG